jgi:outer membrane assembly lipoprotein YfiO
MNKNRAIASVIILSASLTPALSYAKTKTERNEFKNISLSTPVFFDKETLKMEAKQDVHTPLLRKKASLTKTDRKVLKKDLDNLVYRKAAKELSFKELRQATNLAIQLGWYDKALMYLHQMVTTSKDSEVIKVLKLEVADILFEKSSLEKAGEAFEEYLSLYPGSDQSEYAHYKHVLCTFYQTLKTDQDQGPTRQAIQLAETYLEKGLAYKTYRSEIVQIRQHCQLMLYENELNVFKKESFGAASGRLAYLKKQYLPKLPQVESSIISLECRLAQAQGNKELYTERLAFLNKKFPQHGKTTRVAQRNKKSFTDRF